MYCILSVPLSALYSVYIKMSYFDLSSIFCIVLIEFFSLLSMSVNKTKYKCKLFLHAVLLSCTVCCQYVPKPLGDLWLLMVVLMRADSCIRCWNFGCVRLMAIYTRWGSLRVAIRRRGREWKRWHTTWRWKSYPWMHRGRAVCSFSDSILTWCCMHV